MAVLSDDTHRESGGHKRAYNLFLTPSTSLLKRHEKEEEGYNRPRGGDACLQAEGGLLLRRN